MSTWSAWNSAMVEKSEVFVNGITFVNAEENDISMEDMDRMSMRILELKDKVYDRYGVNVEVNQIRFDLKGSTAGMALLNENVIRINTQIFLENKEEYIENRTLGHEYAHLVNRAVYNGSGHDLGWKRIMHFFGLNDSRCHDYEVEHLVKRHKRPYVYHCGCKEFRLTQRMHNTIVRGNWRKCSTCGGILKFQYKEHAS